MAEKQKTKGMLSPYRVLDLTDEKGLMCGKLLGDLGADVIKIERPGGDSARSIGPFYHDETHPEKSLFWFALNASKRGITLDIETADGQEIFKRLGKGADFIIESFPPGYMDKLGLGYAELEKLNPGIIMASITPFGQSGPYKNYKASDIVVWAMGGHMHTCGDADRPPVRISHYSQAYFHAATDAAVGAMMALYHREMTGEGQHVDVSTQRSLSQATWMLTSVWDMMGLVRQRGGLSYYTTIRTTRRWPCKDGYIVWFYVGGAQGMRQSPQLIELLDSEGMATDFLKEFDWSTFDLLNTTQEVVDRLEEPVAKLMKSHTKAELFELGVKYRVIFYPVSTTRDILDNPQLTARGFWEEMEHSELGTTISYPGGFAHTTEAPPRISRRAPLIGEHNYEVYEEELGLSSEELQMLKQRKVI